MSSYQEKIWWKRKEVLGWALYDWANSAFATTVIAGFFPVFFKNYWSDGIDVNLSTARLGFSASAAGLIIAFLSPFLGTLSDLGRSKKKWLFGFTMMGVLATAALFLIPKGEWVLAAICYTFAFSGFSGAILFYNALLPSIATEKERDMVSSLGFSLGYLGGGLLFLFNIIATLQPHIFGLSGPAEAVKYSFLSVAIWWGGFAFFTFLWVPEKPSQEKTLSLFMLIKTAISRLNGTLRKIVEYKNVTLFLIAYWFYIDGVDTVMIMAVDFGMSIGFESTKLITALLITQFVGFPAALVVGKLGENFGAKKTILATIVIYALLCLWGSQMTQVYEFYLIAVAIGLILGGMQALSRSFFSKMIPENHSGEFFGFYNIVGKFAAVVGPGMMALVGLIAKSLLTSGESGISVEEAAKQASRWSMASISLLFFLGGVFLLFVKDNSANLQFNRSKTEA